MTVRASRESIEFPQSDADEERPELRAGAAGIVGGFGAFFLVRFLTIDSDLSLSVGVLEAPFFMLSLALLYAGLWLLRSDFDTERVGRVAACSLVGFFALASVAIWLVGGQGVPLHRSMLLTLDVGAIGASSGLLVGLESERRFRRVDHDAIAASLAAERAEERFTFFNQLLRHHLLNGVAVVQGHAELLSAEYDDPPEEARIIRHRSDEIVALVRNVDTLSRAFTGDLPRRPIDLEPSLRSAIQTIREERPATEVVLDAGEGIRIVANDRIKLAFVALLRTAAGATDGNPVTVRIRTERAGEGETGSVVISFEFEGPRCSETITAFDRTTHGETDLGRFLAETLIEHAGGTIDGSDTGRSGLSVRLRRAG